MNKTNPNNTYCVYNIFVIFLAVFFVLIISNRLFAQTQEEDVIFFDSNTNSISEESQELLNKMAESLKNVEEYNITLEGYSDITGKADYNLELSQERARLVKDYLVDLGIESSKIDTVGKGGTEKYGAGETNESLQANRRVNLIVDIPFVPAIEIEPEETQEEVQDEPEATQEPQEPEPTLEPEVAQEQVIDDNAGEALEVGATPIPVQPISEEVSKSIEKRIRQNAPQGIIFIAPTEMQIGETYKVQAEVSRAFIDALSKDLQDWWFENKIGLSLKGSTFDISTQPQDNNDLKIVGKDTPAIWEWDVIPTHDGINSLILAVVLNVSGSENQVARGEYSTFQRVIDVESNLVHSITSSYWIMGILIILIILVVAWVLMKKLRLT